MQIVIGQGFLAKKSLVGSIQRMWVREIVVQQAIGSQSFHKQFQQAGKMSANPCAEESHAVALAILM